MNLQHVNVKIYVDGQLTVDLERFIEVFHGWVAEQAMSEMMIDVVDYRHVPAGPGVVMVGLVSDYAIDHRDNQFGLLYNRKGAMDGSNCDRIRHALRSAARVCLLLEKQFEGLKFSRRNFELLVNDRALAPNSDESRESCREEFQACLEEIGGDDSIELQFNQDPRARLGAVITLGSDLDFEQLV